MSIVGRGEKKEIGGGLGMNLEKGLLEERVRKKKEPLKSQSERPPWDWGKTSGTGPSLAGKSLL